MPFCFIFYYLDNIYYFYFCCSATGGADSEGHVSEEGSPVEDKDGQQAFGAGKYYLIAILTGIIVNTMFIFF